MVNHWLLGPYHFHNVSVIAKIGQNRFDYELSIKLRFESSFGVSLFMTDTYFERLKCVGAFRSSTNKILSI